MSPTHEILAFSQMTDEEIARVLKENKIGLVPDEARYISKLLGRDPTLTEAVIFGIQGSEHCSYRSSRQHLKMLPTQAPNVMLGVGEDSGIVEIAHINGKRYGIIMAHESHNHPSQVVPYEGAATGVGGIVRDVLCMGGRVIATADPLRFGDLKNEKSRIVTSGVIDGIAGYGNAIGVPNLAGDAYFNKNFDDNCLVNVVALGVVAEDEVIHSRIPSDANGYDIIFVGKPTDNSGMGGAAFASVVLKEEEREINKGAVQEPNPFLKRHILRASYDLFEILKKRGDIQRVGFKDMGAGGNTCASLEMAAASGFGAEVDLEKVHVAMENLHPSVIACAETQERLCWMCPSELTQLILDHYNKKWALPEIAAGARASHVGKVKIGNYVLKYKGEIVCDAPPKVLTEGLRYERAYDAPETTEKEPIVPEPATSKAWEDQFIRLLASPNIASRAPIYENYDKVVQGQTIIEPGEADAGVMAPFRNREDISLENQRIGIALSVDANPRYARINPYEAAVNAVCESARNVAAVGATPWAVTDCLNFGNPEKPDHMWTFIESVRGITDALCGIGLRGFPKGIPIPCISGNVSFYNESPAGAIDPSPVIGMLGRLTDVRKTTTMQCKEIGNDLYLIGLRKNELGGSAYYELLNVLGTRLPIADPAQVRKEIDVILEAFEQNLILACHDISDGGLAVAIAEMLMGGQGTGTIGADIELASTGASDVSLQAHLFGETGGFAFEASPESAPLLQEIATRLQIPLLKIGCTKESPDLTFLVHGTPLFTVPLSAMSHAWLNGLRSLLR